MTEPMVIVNLSGGLPERGHIKIGKKGEKRESKSGGAWQPPQKLDHFIITTMVRGTDGNFEPDTDLMKQIASASKSDWTRLTRIPVRLLYNDIGLNFATRYAAYEKPGRAFCSGNGDKAQELQKDGSYSERECPCDRVAKGFNPSAGNPKCKPNGILTVEIAGAKSIGGVWKFRTTSWNTIKAILGQLAYYQALTGGELSGLPLVMTVGPKQVAVEEKQQTIYMVDVVYPGSADMLREAGYQVALRRVQAGLKMETVEETARKMLALPDVTQGFPGETEDSLAEFYQDVVANDQASGLRKAVGEATQDGMEPEAEISAQESAESTTTGSEPEFATATAEQIAEFQEILERGYGPDGAIVQGQRFCAKYGIAEVRDATPAQVQAAIEKVKLHIKRHLEASMSRTVARP